MGTWNANKWGFMTDISSVLQEREKTYGSFKDHAQIAQGLKDIVHKADSWLIMEHHHKEALDMICHKIARIANGDPDYADSWIDIIGYATIALDIIRE